MHDRAFQVRQRASCARGGVHPGGLLAEQGRASEGKPISTSPKADALLAAPAEEGPEGDQG